MAKYDKFYDIVPPPDIFDHDALARQLAYEEVFLGSETGFKVFQDLVAQCGLYRTAFHKDPNEMAFNVGQQAIGHFIVNTIKAHLRKQVQPEHYGEKNDD